MKFKFISVLLLTVISFPAFADNICAINLQFGIPTVKSTVKPICKTAFITAYDYSAKIPNWVAYTVTPDTAIGCVKRSSGFREEEGVPTRFRSKSSDYAKTGYDIGHMADAASMSYNPITENESFVLSNTAPQEPSLNRGIWRILEIKIRAWAYSGKHVTVYTGTIYDNKSVKIGNGVVVPDKFYKIVVDNTTNSVAAFLFDNEPTIDKNLVNYQTTVADIEQQSGLVFPVPGDKTQIGKIWPANSRQLAKDKKITCGVNTP